MKNKILIVVLFIAVGVLTYLLLKKSEQVKDSQIAQQAKENVKLDVENLKQKLDNQGLQHTIMSDKENIVKSIKEIRDSSDKKKLDSVTKLLNIRDKQLTYYASYSASLEGKLLKAEKTDTGFYYSDKWANIQYVKPKDTSGNGHFNFKYNAEINYAEYWKKSSFIAPKKHYIDFWINDPRATINGVKRLKIEAKEPSLKIEGSSMVMYDGQAHFGADVGINIGKVKVGTSYMYNTVTGDWKPYYYGKFKLIGF
ncbi:MAG: hypothetical protein LBF27_25760 [Sphingobacterium sp.]|jgi:hypothetical protein|nr:hypothetical protein [Sphingobacterium sp.]